MPQEHGVLHALLQYMQKPLPSLRFFYSCFVPLSFPSHVKIVLWCSAEATCSWIQTQPVSTLLLTAFIFLKLVDYGEVRIGDVTVAVSPALNPEFVPSYEQPLFEDSQASVN